MKRYVAIDSNIVVDLLLKRTGFDGNAERIFEHIEAGTFVGCISSSAITDIYFIVESKTSPSYAWEMMEYLYRTLRIVSVVRKTIRVALDSGMADFEDAVQAAAAKGVRIDTIVTRDKTGFINSGLRVYSPEEFLETLR
jgi:predicted nucleic acid-binding protein